MNHLKKISHVTRALKPSSTPSTSKQHQLSISWEWLKDFSSVLIKIWLSNYAGKSVGRSFSRKYERKKDGARSSHIRYHPYPEIAGAAKPLDQVIQRYWRINTGRNLQANVWRRGRWPSSLHFPSAKAGDFLDCPVAAIPRFWRHRLWQCDSRV